MDAAFVTVIALGCVLAGLLAGWFAGAARAGERAAVERATLAARVAAAEAGQTALGLQLEQQRTLHHELGQQARFDQAARDERERR